MVILSPIFVMVIKKVSRFSMVRFSMLVDLTTLSIFSLFIYFYFFTMLNLLTFLITITNIGDRITMNSAHYRKGSYLAN